MTHEETIKRIQSLVPSVMALDFGCEFLYEEKKYIYTNNTCMMTELHQGCYSIFVATPKGFARSSDTIEINENYPIKILGKPITLAVVLLAISKNRKQGNNKHVVIVADNGFMEDTDMNNYNRVQWNLSKDNFNDQSEETKGFIGGLLTNNS